MQSRKGTTVFEHYKRQTECGDRFFFFLDCKIFIESAPFLMRERGEGGLSSQDFHRLKKIVQKLHANLTEMKRRTYTSFFLQFMIGFFFFLLFLYS